MSSPQHHEKFQYRGKDFKTALNVVLPYILQVGLESGKFGSRSRTFEVLIFFPLV